MSASVEHTPVVFVHGNSSGGYAWNDAVDHLRARGYSDRELHLLDFDEPTPSHEAMAVQIDGFVGGVRHGLGVDEVDIVAHSLGVTGARWWMYSRGRHEHVRRFIGLAGANHGLTPATYAAWFGLTIGPWSVSPFLRADYDAIDGHPLKVMNRDETPGDVRYYTIRGDHDAMFTLDPASPRLCGAEENALIDAGHSDIVEDETALSLLGEWLQ